ncbi:Nramp family divalent metal transporter [Kutzneria chonburiensis]|uniref:Nramp family divalent metal transporter n=2 Tax=Kutzneria chonburiensis TaxID=1483604 RepID=A0ABV6MK90_9PSEU|nr:Nramp family divalent metal transporter [Kutzneria chonburiensis]
MGITPEMAAEKKIPHAAAPIASVTARGRIRGTLAMLGPAFVAAVAYVDPGNYSTNITAGAEFGYHLVWVVLLANLMAMPVQFLSAKVGIVTGRSLPELCAGRYSLPVRWVLWSQAEAVAMATDLAEFLGAALGLNLLFGVPMLPAGAITGVVAFIVLGLQARGHRPFERAVAAMLLIVACGFAYELLCVGPSPASTVTGLLPVLPSGGAVFVAVGIIGATVMPHVIYVHSGLTSRRVDADGPEQRRQALRSVRWDVVIALGLAGIINLTMLTVAAKLFDGTGNAGVVTIADAHGRLGQVAGGGATLAFSVALLASGVSSSSVGTLAGQIVMAGFVRMRVRLVVRRTVTMLPSLLVLAAGLNTTDVLNVSQVALSFGIPFALIPLIAISRDPRVMGAFANRRWVTATMVGIAVTIISLNAALLTLQFFD